MKKRAMNSREIRRKTGIDVQDVHRLLGQVENMVKEEHRKPPLPDSKWSLQRGSIMKQIEHTLIDIKRELNIPSADSQPVVRFQAK